MLYAVKAGGMRVARVQKNSTGDTKDKAEMTKEELELYGTRSLKCCFLVFTINYDE